MKDQNIFFPSNLKFLRSRQGLSQEAMAKLLSFTRAKYTSMENGTVKTFSLEDLSAVSQQSGISIDVLVKTDLPKLGELRLRDLIAGNDVYIKGGNLRVLAITVNRENEENVELVPVKAKAGYRAGYNDPAYIEKLPKFSLPNLPKGRSYRIFPTTGDSMLPIPENTLVIGAFVEDLSSIRTGTLCIVVLKGNGEDFVFKSVENRLASDRSFVMHSLNEIYGPFTVPAEDVLEMWQMTSYISDTVPAGNITMGSIASALKDIQVKVGTLLVANER